MLDVEQLNSSKEYFNKGSFKYYVMTYRGRGSSQSITIDYNILREGGPAKVLEYYTRSGGVHFFIKSCGFRIRRYYMSFFNKLKTFVMHTDLNILL